jgi:hypothetical protein
VLDNYSRKILAWTVTELFDASNTCRNRCVFPLVPSAADRLRGFCR